MEKINIAIVDDHNLFRKGLKLLLSKSANSLINNIYEYSNGKDFINDLDLKKTELVLMDIAMPEMDGIETSIKALKIKPNLNIIALTMYSDENYYNSMINAGVKGFLLKEAEINEVIKAINTVISGNNYFSVDVLCNIIKQKNTQNTILPIDCDLSDREIEVLHEICNGLSNQEIANKLFLSKRTVDKHRANILAKTNCKNTANLVVFAMKNNLVKI